MVLVVTSGVVVTGAVDVVVTATGALDVGVSSGSVAIGISIT